MPVLAFESRGGENVVIAAGEVIEDDLYVMAGTFTLDGTIEVTSSYSAAPSRSMAP